MDLRMLTRLRSYGGELMEGLAMVVLGEQAEEALGMLAITKASRAVIAVVVVMTGSQTTYSGQTTQTTC